MGTCVNKNGWGSGSPWPRLHAGDIPNGLSQWHCEGQDCTEIDFISGIVDHVGRPVYAAFANMQRERRFVSISPNTYVPDNEEFNIYDHIYGACCVRYDIVEPGDYTEHEVTVCREMRDDLCAFGWRVSTMWAGSTTVTGPDGELHSYGPYHCRYKTGYPQSLDMVTWDPNPPWTNPGALPPAAPSRFHGYDKVCECTGTVEPYLPQDYIDHGITGCVRGHYQVDPRTWEEACDIPFDPTDGFECQPDHGMPVTVLGDGTAAFYGGRHRVSVLTGQCRDIIADPAFAEYKVIPIACLRQDPGTLQWRYGRGYVSQPSEHGSYPDIEEGGCAAAYMDLEWDEDFDCD